jgi:hypothetical protein
LRIGRECYGKSLECRTPGCPSGGNLEVRETT